MKLNSRIQEFCSCFVRGEYRTGVLRNERRANSVRITQDNLHRMVKKKVTQLKRTELFVCNINISDIVSTVIVVMYYILFHI
jgi:hypothetical protein